MYKWCAVVGISCIAVCMSADGADRLSSKADIKAFNTAFSNAIKSMDNAAVLALWAEDGVSLLPDEPPIIGKSAITKYMSGVMAQFANARMQQFEFSCFDIVVAGSFASEWCQEHQIVAIEADKPPFDGWGKLLLVLHREKNGAWRITREMWNHSLPAR